MFFDTLYDCREFLKQYEDLNDSPIYGNTDFVTQYLLETYESEILYDLSQIKIAYFDLECETEGGFPDLRNPNEKINIIGVRICWYQLCHHREANIHSKLQTYSCFVRERTYSKVF
jgi:hypothetical protein